MILSSPPPTVSARDLAERAVQIRESLKRCELCEWRCGIDRTRTHSAPCHLGTDTHVFCQYLSLTEEPEVVPALRIYFGGCNFRCRFCDTAPECFVPNRGSRIDPPAYAAELAQAVTAGAKSISILGGEPTLHAHTLLELAAADPTLPIALNSNLYMTPEVIDQLRGVAALYLGDFKFGNDGCAERLAGAPRYFEVITRNILHILEGTPLIVRHLLMPGHFDCCFRPVINWLSRNTPGIRFQLYTGYVPCWRASADPDIGRLNTRAEAREAVELLRNSPLNWRSGQDGPQGV